MALINIFSSGGGETGHLTRLFSGSFTVDADGAIITCTLPSAFPQSHVREIANNVLTAFREAKNLEMPLTQIVIHFAAMKITAREMRGGAIIFLAPETTR
jgi:hypothetical protein